MKMFREYKKSSCLLECAATQLLREYGCLPYYMPSLPAYFIRKFLPNFGKPGNNQTIHCNFKQLKAMANDIARLSALGSGNATDGFGKIFEFIGPEFY